jgi:exodeoxyribonuclease VII large subunit
MNDSQHSLFDLQRRVKGSLEDSFALPVWVKAEISEMSVNRSGHCYLDLIETEPGTDQVIARCRATIWSYSFRIIKPYFETTTRQEFSQGIKVLVQAKVEYHEVFGLSLNIRDIDPVYTLGDMARQRAEIISRLEEDGVFDMNKDIELPLVAQRIAVISSPTAAGLQDFLDQLHQNKHKFKFYTKLFSAVMQGHEAPKSITAALEQVFNYEHVFDAVVIIRGGGAQFDLACFDNYELAFHVAQFPLPVITGIGHDKDDTVIDLVAHTRMKTPTAVAEFLISGALQFSLQLNELENHLIDLVSEQIKDKKERLNDAADNLNLQVNRLLEKQRARLDLFRVKLENCSANFLKTQHATLKDCSKNVNAKVSRFVSQKSHLLEQSGYKLNYSFREQILKSRSRQNQLQNQLKFRCIEAFRLEKKTLKTFEEKLRLVDPQNILKRGYSLTLKEGKIVKSVDQIRNGDRLETKLCNGTIESIVENTSHPSTTTGLGCMTGGRQMWREEERPKVEEE